MASSDLSINYSVHFEQYYVGYAPRIDELFVYWFWDDIVHCLGQYGKYQVCFAEDVDWETFQEIGEL